MNSYANKKYDFLWTSKRLIVLALLFGASFINYVDRVNMSVAAPAIAKEFGWNPATMGIVLSSFLWAYAAALTGMIQVTPHMRILVAVEAVDFRNGIDGLAKVCKQQLKADPFSAQKFKTSTLHTTAPNRPRN